MSLIEVLVAVLLTAGAIVGWIVLHRKLRGDDAPLIGAVKRRGRNREGENELEAFIAAYRDGKIDPSELANSDGRLDPTLGSEADANDAGAAVAAAGESATEPSVALPPVAKALLRPEVKLAYLTFRSGLRDHHVFVNVRLGDLGYGIAVGMVDLLVCDAAFNYVAAIDIHVEEQPEDIPKATFLRRAGLKHLVLATRSMPKPAQLRELLYGEAAA